MQRSLLLGLGLLVSVLASPGASQEPPSNAETADRPQVEALELGEHLTLESQILGESRRVRIALPEHYDSTDTRCCVLYLLDGDSLFVQACGSVRHLGAFDAPPTIVVGIDNTQRTRDLTPTASDPETLNNHPGGGGSAPFRRFLLEELRPFIEGRYRTRGLDLLAGHSFGGLFAAETLLEAPEAFDGFLILSPSLWWDDAAFVKRFQEAPDDHGLFQRFVWMAMGDEGAGMNPHFEAVCWNFADRAPAGFRWDRRHFPGHDHWSAALPSLNEGLRSYFKPLRTLGEEAETFDEFLGEFRTIQAEFGDAVPMTAGPLVRRARHLAELGRRESAISLLHDAEAVLSDEPLLIYVQAELHASEGQFKAAIGLLERGLERFAPLPRHATGVQWLQTLLEQTQARLDDSK